jgi:LmbE family N-acetylglucosaminyl deacetylase
MQLEPVFQTPFRILIIVAHPDDVEFGAGGSTAVWTNAGAEVIYCIVTDGAAGSNEKEIVYDELIERRRQEQYEAARHVGVKDVYFLGYADGTLQPTLELRRDLTRLIRQLRPNRVVTMDPTVMLVQEGEFSYINHPDHRASSEAALYAVFPSAETRPIFPELLGEGLEPFHVNELYLMLTQKPNTAVDISKVVDRKIQSLLAHRSQLDESVVDMVKGWDSRAGADLGIEYAEVFRVMRFYNEQPSDQPSSA